MSYANIKRLRNSSVTSVNYFVDANVWIYSMQPFDELHGWQRAYCHFFFDIVESQLDPQPKILMPTLLTSEIINTYLRIIALPEYKQIEGIGANEEFKFKRDYRPTQHYRDSYEEVCDDIHSLRESLIFLDDSKVVTKPDEYLISDIDPFDFNDYFYYKLCQEFKKDQPVSILTNDGDFQIEDIEIITSNSKLLTLR